MKQPKLFKPDLLAKRRVANIIAKSITKNRGVKISCNETIKGKI